MMDLNFMDKFRVSLSQLPGEDCHLEVSPLGRRRSSEALERAVNPKQSAVAIVLFESDGDPHSILIERAIYRGVHSGQIAFPGGKKDTHDATLLDTALRETEEEIGLSGYELELMGGLTPVYIPVSNFIVQPYVFLHHGIPNLVPDTREVVDAFSFSLQGLTGDCLGSTSIQIDPVNTLENVPFFDIHQKIVWGATALIMNEIRTLIRRDNLL